MDTIRIWIVISILGFFISNPASAQFHGIDLRLQGGTTMVVGFHPFGGSSLAYVYRWSEKNAVGILAGVDFYAKNVFGNLYYPSDESFDVHPRSKYSPSPSLSILYRKYAPGVFYEMNLGVGMWHESFSAVRGPYGQPPVDFRANPTYPYIRGGLLLGLPFDRLGEKKTYIQYETGIPFAYFFSPYDTYIVVSESNSGFHTFKPMGGLKLGLTMGFSIHFHAN